MSWIDHVKKYAKEHNVSYGQALKDSKESYMKGGSLSSKDLKKVLASTYESKNKDIGDFTVDKDLSGKRAKVYHNNDTGQTIVAHRGTASAKDWLTDAEMALGYEGGNRFKHAKDIQKKAQEKYGTENLTTVGHSLAGRLAEKYGGQNNSEIITLNKAVVPSTMFDKVPKNQYDIRSSTDVVSDLISSQKNKNLKTIKAQTYNPLLEHKTNILNRKTDKVFGKEPEQLQPIQEESNQNQPVQGSGMARRTGKVMKKSKLMVELEKRKS